MDFIPTQPDGGGIPVDVVLEVRRIAFLEAAALLEDEARERFRRGSWLGALGHYWGWRAAADRIRLAAEED